MITNSSPAGLITKTPALQRKKKSSMTQITERGEGKRIALYRRVSTDQQAEQGYSLDHQLEKLQAKAATYDEVESAIDYMDDGYSGATLDRPAMQRLIADIEAGKIDTVIVLKLDRLSRSQKDTLYLIEDVFNAHNVAFCSIQENLDTGSPFGRAMIGLLSVFAQLERENIYARTRSGMLKRVESGLHPGGCNVPYCFDYNKATGKLELSDKAEIGRYAAERYLAGDSIGQISKVAGVCERIVYNMLTSPTSYGNFVYNGVEYENTHEGFISKETHNAIMSIMRARAAARTTTKTDHLLSGIIYCGHCGARMRYIRWGKPGADYKLMCYSRQTSKEHMIVDPDCRMENVWAEDVEEGVVRTLFTAVKDNLEGARKLIDSEGIGPMLSEQLERAEARLRKLYRAYSDSDDEYLMDAIREAKAEVDRIKELIEDQELKDAAEVDAMFALDSLKGIEDVWPMMSVKERRVVLASVIERIEVTETTVNVHLRYGLSNKE